MLRLRALPRVQWGGLTVAGGELTSMSRKMLFGLLLGATAVTMFAVGILLVVT